MCKFQAYTSKNSVPNCETTKDGTLLLSMTTGKNRGTARHTTCHNGGGGGGGGGVSHSHLHSQKRGLKTTTFEYILDLTN